MFGFCVDLDTGGLVAGSNATIWGGSYSPLGATCDRQFVIISSDAFAALSAGGGASSGSTAGFSPDEVIALKYQASNPSPFNLSFQDASLISGLVLAVWAAAVAIRAVVGIFNNRAEE